MKLISIIAVFGFFGVAFGAFGAHAVADLVSPERLSAYKTGVLYHLFHTLAALAIASLALKYPQWGQLRKVAYLFLAGIVVFSGSLYGLVIFDISAFGPITPMGGSLFLAGWAWLAVFAWSNKND